jgi:FtsP/CotA-like multicopper oxidase with cupredoxin domain
MTRTIQRLARFLLALGLAGAGAARATPFVQCPAAVPPQGGDPQNQTAVVDWPAWKAAHPGYSGPPIACMHLAGGDGFASMADGKTIYTFGFSDVTKVPVKNVVPAAAWGAESPAPTIEMTEGDDFYLTLSNVTMLTRPDLNDPHSVHFHGFPQASSIFDGMPEGSISVFAGSSITYFYRLREPGTYMYHCHVEAPEHMQMGMTGSLFVHPIQDRKCRGELGPKPGYCGGFRGFAYNDGDGSTGYDVEFPIQIQSYDPVFHAAELFIQPLPMQAMVDKYALLNGRGYPDTIAADAAHVSVTDGDGNALARAADPLPSSSVRDNFDGEIQAMDTRMTVNGSPNPNFGKPLWADMPANNDCDNPQPGGTFCTKERWVLAGEGLPPPGPSTMRVGAFVQVQRGQRLLLRISSLDVTRVFTLAAYGFSMKIVGQDARQLRAYGADNAFETSSVTLGGGEAVDALVETAALLPGRYFLYTTNLNYLSNFEQDNGGMMTEIVIN